MSCSLGASADTDCWSFATAPGPQTAATAQLPVQNTVRSSDAVCSDQSGWARLVLEARLYFTRF